jgi:hypothetical protein
LASGTRKKFSEKKIAVILKKQLFFFRFLQSSKFQLFFSRTFYGFFYFSADFLKKILATASRGPFFFAILKNRMAIFSRPFREGSRTFRLLKIRDRPLADPEFSNRPLADSLSQKSALGNSGSAFGRSGISQWPIPKSAWPILGRPLADLFSKIGLGRFWDRPMADPKIGLADFWESVFPNRPWPILGSAFGRSPKLPFGNFITSQGLGGKLYFLPPYALFFSFRFREKKFLFTFYESEIKFPKGRISYKFFSSMAKKNC